MTSADKLTPAELAAENERLKLACQAYRKFIQAEMHFEGYRGEFYGQKASEQNCLKLEAWLKEHGLYTAGDDLLAELAALREQLTAERAARERLVAEVRSLAADYFRSGQAVAASAVDGVAIKIAALDKQAEGA